MAKAEKAEGLQEQHREFVPLVAAIETTEESIGWVEPSALRISTASLHESLAHGLIPHAVGEGRTVFPVLRRLTGNDEVAVTMNRDHQEIGRLTDELERIGGDIAGSGLNADQERRLGSLLHDLRRVIERHFESEQEACFSILRAELRPNEARELCRALERATAEVRELYE